MTEGLPKSRTKIKKKAFWNKERQQQKSKAENNKDKKKN